MLKNPRTRRSLAIGLIVVGGLLILLAPEVWAGVVMLALGVVIEVIGIALEHRNQT